jgi:hypothetical protein
MRVVGQEICKTAHDSAAATFLVWDQARAALTATQATTAERNLLATTVRYERYYDANQRTLRGQRVQVHADSASAPWQEQSADVLHRLGYITGTADDSTTFYAPGIETLLSEIFAEDHCFHLQRGDDSTRVGLAFEPIESRAKVPEVHGTLWLDRATAELKEMEYGYTNVTPARVVEVAGGALSFARAGKAGWVISAWDIHMPILSTSPAVAPITVRGAMGALHDPPRVTGVKVSGGVLAMMREAADTIWRHPAVSLTVAVIDSVTGQGVPNAVVSLDESGMEQVADASGRATFSGLGVGNETLRIHTPDLDPLGVATQLRISILDSSMTLSVRTPNAERILALGGSFGGHVVSTDKHAPVIAAEVSVPDLGMVTRTDGTGAFKLEHLPPGPHDVVVRRIGFGPASAKVPFIRNQIVQRTFELDPVVLLDSVIVTDQAVAASMATFEEHRKLGLGTFFTRDAIAGYEASGQTSSILQQVNGLKIVRPSRSARAYVMSTRRPPSISNPNGGCLSQVYLDHQVIYRGGGTGEPPFDINSIAPDQIQAIEFYAGPAETPSEYQTLNSDCGVLVIWTRTP